MSGNKKGYVNLDGWWKNGPFRDGYKFTPRTPTVQLSGKLRKRFRIKPRGMNLERSLRETNLPRSGTDRIFYGILSALSAVLVFLGIYNIFGKGSGEQPG
jgi:hypothetical protein